MNVSPLPGLLATSRWMGVCGVEPGPFSSERVKVKRGLVETGELGGWGEEGRQKEKEKVSVFCPLKRVFCSEIELVMHSRSVSW